jgi:hypothetical protein
VDDEPTIKPMAYDDHWKTGMEEYLKMLCVRFFLIKDLLSDEGCFWVHLDWHVVHYVKILLDEIFGEDNFVNEIIWNYKSGGTGKRNFSRKHDTLLFYSKSKKYYFNPLQEKSYNRGFKPYRFKGVQEYEDELGWYTEFNFATTEKFSWDDSEDPLQDFEDYCVKMIDNGVPIMVDWSDWGGHWQCIIGIDTCQEDNSADDVLILADPYDTSDQYQDGYYTYGAERFFYQWHEGEASTLDGPAQQPYLVAMPMEKAEELGLK